jgi:hypothetical protein
MKKIIIIAILLIGGLTASAQTYEDTLKALTFEELDSVFRKTQVQYLHVQKDMIFNSTLEPKFKEIGRRLEIISRRREFLLQLERI